MIRSLLCLAVTLALGACDKPAENATGGTAGGEILPGSTSDAMLPLDSLRSQPPLAPQSAASGKPSSAAKGAKAAVSETGAANKGAQTDATATPPRESSPAPNQ